jgi:LuxR family maltose regulon positive regulatory protein
VTVRADASHAPPRGAPPSQTDAPPWLLPTKLAVPTLGVPLDVRRRLAPRVDAALRRPLTVVAAPAGFGKTTLLAAWRASPAGASRALAWVTLDATDNDPARFWGYLVAALRTTHPSFGDAARAALRGPSATPETIASTILRDLADVPDDLVLVLDDFELIEAESIHRGLTFLVEHAPLHLHLVVLSRIEPALPLARLRARGKLAEIGADQLRFDTDETAAFLTHALGRTLSDDVIRALATATEGWAVGLQLAALALDGQPDPASVLAHFSGGHRYVLDYLVEEVLQRQPGPIQEFLLRTAIVDRLSGELCDAVTGGDRGQAILDQLERANLFVVALDPERRWYRYHLQFREALRHRLRTARPGAVRALHARAAEWFEQHGFATEAVEHSLHGHDWPEAMRRIKPLVMDVNERGERVTLDRWLTPIPEAILITDATTCLSRAWSLLQDGQVDAAERLGRLASAKADELGEQGVQGLSDAFQAHCAAVRGDGRAAVEHGQRALRRLPAAARVRRAVALLHIGFGQLLCGELAAAASALEQAVALIVAADARVYFAVRALSHLGYVRQLQGNLAEAERLYRDVVRRCGDSHPRDQAGALIRLGNLLRERNDLDVAADFVDAAIRLDRQHDGWYLREAYTVLGRIQSARGSPSEAFRAFEQAATHADRTGHSPAGRRARAYATRPRLIAGDVQAAIWWATTASVRTTLAEGQLPGFEHEVETLTLVRVWIAQGQTADALSLLGRLRPLAEAAGRQTSTVELLALEALALAAARAHARAQACLVRALTLAEPSGFVRLFIDEGVAMARLLEALAASQRRGELTGPAPSPGYLRRLLTAFVRAEPESARDSAPIASSLPDPLTPRELELLRLMATGASNQQIADRLIVSMPTVKTHVNRVFRKLDASSRLEAVARGRDLGLLGQPGPVSGYQGGLG